MTAGVRVSWRSIEAALTVIYDGRDAHEIVGAFIATAGLEGREAGDFMAAVCRVNRLIATNGQSARVSAAEIQSIFCELGGDHADLAIAAALAAVDPLPKEKGRS